MVDAATAAAPAPTGTAPVAGSDGASAALGAGAAPAAGAAAVPDKVAGANPDGAAAATALSPAGDSAGGTDWRSTITDPDHLEFAKRHASVADLTKSAVELRKANGSMTRVPGKDASAEDVAKFNKLIGVPATATEYKFDDGGRQPTDADRAVQGKLAEIFLANRVPAEAATALSKAVNEIAAGIKDEQNRVAIQARENTTAALRKELGADYDSHLVLADRAVKQWGNPGFNELLNKSVDGVKLGDHPDFVRVFGSIGRRMGEGGFIGAVGGTERQSLQSELNELMTANPPGTPSYASPAVQARVAQIHQSLHGSGVAVGVGGRSS